MKDIGKNIKEYRIKKNLSREEMAERLEVSKRTIFNYETGRSRPSLDMLEKIAEELGVGINEIVYGYSSAENNKKHMIVLISVSGVIIAAAIVVLIIGANCAYSQLRNSNLWGFTDAYIYLIRPLMMFVIGICISLIIRQFGIVRPATKITRNILIMITIVILLAVIITIFHGIVYLGNQVWADIQVVNAKFRGAYFINGYYPISVLGTKIGMIIYHFVEQFWMLYLLIGVVSDLLLFNLKGANAKV